MNILIDLRILSADWSGIAVYSSNLVQAILKNNSSHKYFFILKNQDAVNKLNSEISRFKKCKAQYVFLDFSIYNLRNIYYLNKIIKQKQIDIYFTPQFFWFYGAIKTKVIPIIYDIIPLTHPDLLNKSLKTKLRFIFNLATRLTLKYSYKVIVISKSTLNEIEKYFGKNLSKKCHILHPVFKKEVTQNDNAIDCYKQVFPQINMSYILYVGRQNPYKNIVRLIKAFHSLKSKGLNKQLVIAGRVDVRYPEALNVVDKLNLKPDVIFTNFIDKNVLQSLYKNCDFVIQPSLIEGFGLTALEAFIYQKIPITSNINVLTETLQNSSISFNPMDIDSISQAINKAYSLSSDQKENLINQGMERIDLFSAENVIDKWHSIITD